MREKTSVLVGDATLGRAAKWLLCRPVGLQPILLPLFLLLASLAPDAMARQPLILGGGYSEYPLSSPQQTGMLDRLVKEVFARLGIPVILAPLPSERSLINANSGITDGDINRIEGINRLYPNLIQVPERTMAFEFVAFTKRPGLTIENWDSLRPYTVGIITGWKILEEHVTGRMVTKVENARLLFTLLQKGRADVVVYERLQGLHFIKELGLTDVRVVDPPLDVRDMFLYLNKKHADLVPRVAEELRKMKADGTYQAIMSKDAKQ